MISNMGNTDRIVRLIVAALMLIAVATNAVTGWVSLVFIGLGAIFIFTSVIKFCPLYVPFKIRTTGKS